MKKRLFGVLAVSAIVVLMFSPPLVRGERPAPALPTIGHEIDEPAPVMAFSAQVDVAKAIQSRPLPDFIVGILALAFAIGVFWSIQQAGKLYEKRRPSFWRWLYEAVKGKGQIVGLAFFFMVAIGWAVIGLVYDPVPLLGIAIFAAIDVGLFFIIKKQKKALAI